MSTETEAPPTFLVPEGVEVTINGVEHKFYAVSLRVFCELKAVLKPIITSLSVYFSPPAQSVKETLKSGDGMMKQIFEPLAPDVVKFGASAREKATADLVDALLDTKHATLMRTLIIDSLRDEFPRGVKPPTEKVAEIEQLDLPTAVAFLRAIVEANAKALRPLLQGVTVQKVREAAAAVTPS